MYLLTVESANGKYHIVDNFDGEVTSRIIHVRYTGPGVRVWVEFFPAQHSGYAVKSTYDVNMTMVRCARDSRSSGSHWGNQ